MATLLQAAESPFKPEVETRHAGKVFVFTKEILLAVNAVGSDESDPTALENRFLLCLWDVSDDTSLWITLQSVGEFEVLHASKRLYAGCDKNWMDSTKITYHRDGTLWRLGSPGKPVKFKQKQQRAIAIDELLRIRTRISQQSVAKFL